MTRYAGFILFLFLLASPNLATAHSPIQGLNHFYNGLLHPVFVPAHLLLIIALGLFLGQQGAKKNQAALITFLVSTIAGLVAAWFSTGSNMEILLLSGAAITGLLVAANLSAAVYACSSIGAVVGFMIGLDSAQEAISGKERLASLFGSGIGIYMLLLYPTALADYLRHKSWQKIGVRVVGSWIAASSILVLAFSLAR